jgi:hypothetical protein
VEIEEALIAEYGWVQDVSFGFRQWRVPPALLNIRARVRQFSDAQEEEVCLRRWMGSD